MNESLDEIEQIFLAFGDKTRLRLLNLMRNREVSVNFLCESLNVSQPKVSRHLAYLRAMGVVHTRRDGKWIYYRLAEPQSRLGSQFLNDALDWIGSISELAVDGLSVEPAKRKRAPNKPKVMPLDDIYGEPDMSRANEELEVYLL